MAWPNGPDENSNDVEEKKTSKTWTLYAKYKKSTVEREEFTKDGESVVVETGWRSGSFTITTEGDDPPAYDVKNEDGVEIYGYYPDGVESVDLNETWDGCWQDVEWPDSVSEEEQERLQERFDEEGYYSVLVDEEGWDQGDTEMWLHGPLVIEDGDGNVVADGEPDSDKQQW